MFFFLLLVCDSMFRVARINWGLAFSFRFHNIVNVILLTFNSLILLFSATCFCCIFFFSILGYLTYFPRLYKKFSLTAWLNARLIMTVILSLTYNTYSNYQTLICSKFFFIKLFISPIFGDIHSGLSENLFL